MAIGEVQSPSEERQGHVGVRDVHEPPGADAHPLERVAVGGEGALAVHPGGDVAVVRRGQVRLRHGAEVEDVAASPGEEISSRGVRLQPNRSRSSPSATGGGIGSSVRRSQHPAASSSGLPAR